jgi:hypothetical protein
MIRRQRCICFLEREHYFAFSLSPRFPSAWNTMTLELKSNALYCKVEIQECWKVMHGVPYAAENVPTAPLLWHNSPSVAEKNKKFSRRPLTKQNQGRIISQHTIRRLTY